MKEFISLETYIKNKIEFDFARKLKPGDKVKIKSKEELFAFYPQYNLIGLIGPMLECGGKEFYIERVSGDMGYGEPYFTLLGNDYIWSAYLFDFSEEKSIKKYSLE